MSKWKPIKTLLMGDKIMGFFQKSAHDVLLWPDQDGRAFQGYWNDGSSSWSRVADGGKYNPQNPSHWMPLPEPPK